jgi:hypothetical protein
LRSRFAAGCQQQRGGKESEAWFDGHIRFFLWFCGLAAAFRLPEKARIILKAAALQRQPEKSQAGLL